MNTYIYIWLYVVLAHTYIYMHIYVDNDLYMDMF